MTTYQLWDLVDHFPSPSSQPFPVLHRYTYQESWIGRNRTDEILDNPKVVLPGA